MTVERAPELMKGNETEPIHHAEALVVLGRGVGTHNESGTYAPTALLEKGLGKYKAHTGVMTYNLDPDQKYTDVVIGGANSNVLATYEILEKLNKDGHPLPYLIFAAGRPKYLENAPEGLSEGSVLRDKLESMLTHLGVELPPHELQDQNKATIDDIRESLKSCTEKGYKNIGIITIEPHVYRSWLMANKVMSENPEISRQLDRVFFINSWQVLSTVDPRFEEIFDKVKTTLAYRRTQRLEKGGRRALHRGVTSTSQLPISK